ncbi:hemerythrin domain-containing protein [Rhodobacterales bacterium HKCCE4037]|nr:hemerythrin domain-containing protein [Rhodobacterales bacterium HKCCE4037]
MDDLSLATRPKLPDALNTLVLDFPRDEWQAHPHFHGLVSFWLERHMMFRQLLEALQNETQGILDGNRDPRAYAGAVSRYGGMLVSQLHGHHQIEDHHYFPVLAAKDPRVAEGFKVLDADHHALDGYLNGFVEAVNGGLTGLMEGKDPKAEAGLIETEVTRLAGLLDRHLHDEEDLVVPVILKYGAAGLG